MFAEYDLVRLRRPKASLPVGAIGTIVMFYEWPRRGYEVEFTDSFGVTLALLTLYDDDLEAAGQENTGRQEGQ